mgnify:CR=1 FL=1
MKISELTAKLREINNEFGDIECHLHTEENPYPISEVTIVKTYERAIDRHETESKDHFVVIK